MAVRSLTRDVMAVVRGQRPDTESASDVEQSVADPPLDRQPVVHQFQEVVLRTEYLPPLGGRRDRFVDLPEPQPGLHLPGRATGGGDDALGMFGDDVGIHPVPLAELALEGGQRGQLEQVAQAGGVLGHHGEVGVGTAAGDVIGLLARIAPQDPAGIEPGSGSHIGLDADDGLDPDLGRRVVELAGAEHVAVVGHPDGGHLQALGLGQHGRDLGGTVEHRVLGVVVQMHERTTHRAVSLGLPGDAFGVSSRRVRAPAAASSRREASGRSPWPAQA